MPRVRLALPLLVVLIGAACWRHSPKTEPFSVVRTSPKLAIGGEPLLLNDSVTVYFSSAVNPPSVTVDTVTVLDDHDHQVPGNLRVGQNWVTFEPKPPLAGDLSDGSFQPGHAYRLLVAGYPRPDALRATDGRRLESAATYEFQAISRSATVSPLGLLRPLTTELPFVLRSHDGAQLVPADAPRLRLHFTLPVLPSTATADAFRIQWLGNSEPLVPRSVRVLTSRLDEYPGSTVEIDLGTVPRLRSGTSLQPLNAGDWISVNVQNVTAPLRDYAGNPVIAPVEPCWSVVAGTSVALAEWPVDEGGIVGDDPTMPGFEVVSGVVRPRVRLEAGDGSLGVFRPRRDLVLRPGEPFDRGDGVVVTSDGTTFPFLAIDIQRGITVRIEGGGGAVKLLSCGSIHVDGTLQLATPTVLLQAPRPGTAVLELLDAAPAGLLAAGDVQLRGRIQVAVPLASDHSALTVASAGRIHLLGELPYNTILAVESTQMTPVEPAIVGSRGQVAATVATFTYGLAPGAHWTARACSPWRALPMDRDTGVLRLVDVEDGVRVSWQVAPADAVRHGEPDLTVGRVGRIEAAADLDRVAVPIGSFLRFHLEAEVAAGRPVPTLRELRLVDR